MECSTFYYAGGGQCKALRENVYGMIIKESSTVLTKAAAATEAGLRTALFPAAGVNAVILDFRNGFEPAGGENELTTSNNQFTVKTDVSAIQASAYANMSYSDYNILRSLEGKSVECLLIDKKGNIVETNQDVSNVTGFTGKFFMKNGFSTPGGDKQKDMMFQFYFEELEEWGDKEHTIATAYTALKVLETFQPIGLDLDISVAYAAGGNFTVKVTYRGEARPYAGLTIADKWAVKYANADVGATLTVVDFSDAALGIYVLNVVNGTPADMVGYFDIQGADDDGTYVTYITNVKRINE